MSTPRGPYPDYASGEFSLGFTRPGSAAVVIFDGYLWLLGHGRGTRMWQTTFALGSDFSKRVARGDDWIKDQRNWRSQTLTPGNVPGGMSAYRHCGAAVAVGINPGLYLFWVNGNDDTRLLASCCPPGTGGNPNWGDAWTLTWSDGNVQKDVIPGGDVGAVAFGDDAFLVAVAFQTYGIGLFVYNTNDIYQGDTNWQARSQLFLPIAKLDQKLQKVWPGARIDNIGPNITVAWSAGVENSSMSIEPLVSPKPCLYATVFTKVGIQGKSGQISLPLLVALDESGNLQGSFFLDPLVDRSAAPLQVVRDPAGRLLAFGTFAEPSTQLGCYLYPTNAMPQPGQKYAFAYAQPAPGVDDLPPAVCYYIDTSASPSATPATVTYPVYQFAFYGERVSCQVNYYGYVEILQNAVADTLLPATKFVLNGVIEGPVPIPNQNVAGFTFVPGMVNLGSVLYGATESMENSHQTSVGFTVGFQSSGGSTKGVGPAWDIAFSGGCGWAWGKTEATALSLQRIQVSNVNKTPESVGIGVVPEGNMFGAPLTITATLFKFYDAQGNLVSDASSEAVGTAMKCALIGIRHDPSAAFPYTPFLVTPGDLHSYTPDAINQRMNINLSLRLLKTPKLVHVRRQPWKDYFQDVICANAYQFGEGDNAQKYLDFSWDFNGKVQSNYNTATTSFNEFSWSFDLKAYAGISGGEGLEMFGFGENTQYRFLAGFTLSAKSVTKTAQGHSWGVAVNDWGGPGWGDQNGYLANNDHAKWLKAIAVYDFVMFYLPPPAPASDFGDNYWTAELVDLLATAPGQAFTDVKDIDPNSGTWKILFVVTRYATNEDWFYHGGKWTYQYAGPLPQATTRS
jgi:hypothetical protein